MPDDAATLAARIDALEIRIAYQDETIEELNTALAAQWQEIDKLRREMGLLEAELRAAAESAGEPAAPEPPPPHY
ncbi:MAG: SlyX family protein [Devosia sp.]|nr:SlyX family protein [Devosia sp.]